LSLVCRQEVVYRMIFTPQTLIKQKICRNGGKKLLEDKVMPFGDDEIFLICFIIDYMGQSANEPAKLLTNYHINT